MRFRIPTFYCNVSVLGFLIFFWGSTGVAPSAANAADAIVTDVRVGQNGQTTRLVLDLTNKISFKVFALNKPYRIVIDLPEVGWRLPPRPLPTSIGMLKKMRYGLFKPGTSRIVLDVNKPPRIQQNFSI